MNRLEDAPLHAVLRNAGPYASWRVEFEEQRIVIKANGSGKGQLDISMVIHYEETKDTILSRILLPPPTFELPVDLYVIWWDETMEPEFWDEVLGLTPLLRSVTLGSPLRVTQQVMDRLSTKLQSPSSSAPRAPNLEKLCFQHRRTISLWSEGDEGEAVKTMLDKRRGIFIQGGVQDPPKLAVTGPNGLTFDEAEGRWLGSESSDAGRGLGS
ncbi:hypothetical protein FRC05_004318 [Tulasnella sp. 425]|nr:hypothetical protein FRC05_004318 [Tulasnella sp. 425]